jgi:hypothetical protein
MGNALTSAITVVDPVILELLAKIDEFLSDIRNQSMVDQSRVIDFGLDLRLIIAKEEV